MARSRRFLSTAKAEAPAPPQPTVGMESDFVVILASLLCALICVVGLLAVARCTCLRRRRRAAADADANAAKAPANKGLKKKVLESLPKLTYDGEAAAAGSLGGGEAAKFVNKECAICLGEFVEGDEIRVLPHCGHGFHVGCVDTWLGSHSSCPSCRRVLVVERCQKCGHLPAGAAAVASEAQVKAATSTTTAHNTNNTSDNNFLP